jgi:hypothetical protein
MTLIAIYCMEQYLQLPQNTRLPPSMRLFFSETVEYSQAMTTQIDNFLIQLFSALLLLVTGFRLLLSDWAHLWSIFCDWRVSLNPESTKVNTTEIISRLRGERDRIDAAIAALEGSGVRGEKGTAINGEGRGGRRMGAAARRKISLAQKRRWAKQRREKRSR